MDKSELNKIILEAEEFANSEAFQNASRELKEKFETAKKNAVDVANNQQADADAVKRAVKELENIMELIKGEGIPDCLSRKNCRTSPLTLALLF